MEAIMQTRDISYEQWPRFFEDFNQLNQGKHVNVETVRRGDPVRFEMCDTPLVGIVSAHPRSSKDELIEVVTRESSRAHATHSIEKPERVCLAEEEGGEAIALQIESANGAITMVRF